MLTEIKVFAYIQWTSLFFFKWEGGGRSWIRLWVRETSKFHNWSLSINSRRRTAATLPKRRKTLFNKSIHFFLFPSHFNENLFSKNYWNIWRECIISQIVHLVYKSCFWARAVNVGFHGYSGAWGVCENNLLITCKR